ncbi:MAG: AAA family ATPase, partial [Chloroflexi bacterium]|nr:AAA family ATPase [Chloroflexota bacterium]
MTNGIDVQSVQRMAARIRENVQQVIVGKDEAINLAIIAMLCRGHILVEDTPYIYKTSLSKSLAHLLQFTFRRI